MSRWCFPLLALALVACKFGGAEAHDSPGDPPADAGPPDPLGSGSRIVQVVGLYSQPDSGVPLSSASTAGINVDITGAALVTIDDYDETHNGKSVGTVYVEDVGNGQLPPNSGIQLYKPTYSPANLLVAPGDVVDMMGLYQNYQYSEFDKDAFYPELSEPIVSFRFVYQVPEPVKINVTDLAANIATSKDPKTFAQGIRWSSMLVEVDDVTVSGAYCDDYPGVGCPDDPPSRASIYITTDTSSDGPAIANQLYNINPNQYPPKTHFSKVIGICGYFFSFTISPRSPADLVP